MYKVKRLNINQWCFTLGDKVIFTGTIHDFNEYLSSLVTDMGAIYSNETVSMSMTELFDYGQLTAADIVNILMDTMRGDDQ